MECTLCYEYLKKDDHIIDKKLAPDGQETPHAHLHLIPRFSDEPFAGKGIRHWFKLRENLRGGV